MQGGRTSHNKDGGIRWWCLLGLVAASSACSRPASPGVPSTPAVASAGEGVAFAGSAVGRPELKPVASSTSVVAPAVAVPVPALPPDANVLLISIDSLRADMPWAGYERPVAPRLTELEKKAVSYTRAYAVSSYTSMSLGGLLGGKLPGEMKRDGYFFGTYAKECVLFPEILHDAGISTVSAHAHGYFKNAGFNQGFDRWEIVPSLKWNNTTDENITSPALEALAEKLLTEAGNKVGRFFAWFHFLDPHDKYLPHPGIGPYGKSLRDKYDAEVTFTDSYVGKLLDFVAAQSWGPRTIIVVTADHGESFGEHKMWAHGFELYENLVRVPLFFVIPGVPPRRIDEARSGLDLAPTILGFFGLTGPSGYRGKSLVPEMLGAPIEARDIPLDLPTTSDSERRRGLIHGNLKIVAGKDDQHLATYDLKADPEENSPLVKGEDHAAMVTRYREFVKGVQDVPPYVCKEDNCLNGKYLRKDNASK